MSHHVSPDRKHIGHLNRDGAVETANVLGVRRTSATDVGTTEGLTMA
jgi:hypothetical protein